MIEYRSAKALQNGSTIGIFSPSEWLGDNRPERVSDGAEFLERNGFKVQYARHYLAQDTIRAGTVEQRLADIRELTERPDIDALLATWGGKACNHLIADIEYGEVGSAGKPILGFSDISVLLNAITAKTGLVTFHGPNIAGKLEESTWSDMKFLRREFDWQNTDILGGAKAVGATSLRAGTVEGRIFGGNLNCFVLGVVLSKIDLSFFEKGIFFWEDVGLTPRQIDQFLTALVNIGFMDKISGMVIGDFFAKESHEWLYSDPLESVMHALRNFSFPIVYTPIFGHRKLENPVFPIGARAILDSKEVSLHVAEDVVV